MKMHLSAVQSIRPIDFVVVIVVMHHTFTQSDIAMVNIDSDDDDSSGAIETLMGFSYVQNGMQPT